MATNRPFAHVLSARRRALIELMFEKHNYSEQDVEDFFEFASMDRRFGDEKERIRAAREKRTKPAARLHELEMCTD